MTAKHRVFQFLGESLLPDQKLVAIGLEDAKHLGVLSSAVHGVWALATGSRLGVGNDPVYVKTRCFECFPFPNFHTADKFGEPMAIALVDADGNEGPTTTYGEYPSDHIRNLAEQLDAHRKRQQAAHPGLTLTGMYNVLEKLRSGDVLSPKERSIHEQGLVSVLRQLHDELDEAVLTAYGWGDLVEPLRIAHGTLAAPEGTTREDAKRAFDEAILERLVALNAQRAAAEARGEILWLRPEFQNPEASRAPEQHGFEATAHDSDDDGPAIASPAAAKPMPWPKDTVDQVRAVADVLDSSLVPLTIDDIAARFTARGPWKRRLPQLLAMLAALGRVREADGAYVAS